MSTISIALSSLFGVLAGGYISDRWVLKNVRGRVYTGAMGLGLIIPSLLFIGYGHSIFALVMGAMLFGIVLVCLTQIICLFSVSLCLHVTGQLPMVL